ncbi:kinase-like domain-containing protein [Hyaloraphidium curvatum]|nr:kinase-like domain-containing protein [Hyaloraphidium curvatum]
MSKRRGKAAPDVSAEPISEEKPAKAAPVLQQQVEANSPAAQKDQNPRQLPEQSTAQPSAIFSMFGGDLRRGDKAVDVFALAQATDNHSPASGTEVPLRIGDAVFVERAFANGWASGTNRTRGGQGFFPADFVQIVPERVGSLVEAAQAPPPNEVHASPAPLPAVLYAAERASPYADPRISPIGLPPPADIRASPAFAPLSVSPTAPAPSPDTAGFSVSIPNNGASPSDATPILSPTQPLQATMGFATVQGIPVQRSKLLVGSDDVRVDRSARLGGGGLGEVFLGVLRGSTRVAVRRLPEPMDRETTEVFAREVQGQEGLVQRNVLPLLAFSLQPPMLITDHLPDGNLRNFLLERGWDQPLGLSLLRDAAAGTAYLHAAGIVHGALRSTNVLVDGTRALVSGFGLAGLREKVGGGATVRSAAPEVLAGGGASKEADAYAFAMMCYEVLSDGALPFEGASDDLVGAQTCRLLSLGDPDCGCLPDQARRCPGQEAVEAVRLSGCLLGPGGEVLGSGSERTAIFRGHP